MYLEKIEASFIKLKSAPDQKPLLDKIFRHTHDLKGHSQTLLHSIDGLTAVISALKPRWTSSFDFESSAALNGKLHITLTTSLLKGSHEQHR